MSDPEISIATTPEQQPAPEPAAPPPVEPPASSLASRLFGVLFSPGAAFRQVVARPTWAGALAVYLLAVGASALAYSMKVDWEGLMRSQIEDSLAMRTILAIAPDEQADAVERSMIQEVTGVGAGGMTLRTTMQTVAGGAIGFHFMGILFATLLYLMGALGDLKLGRVWLDGFVCLGVIIAFTILGAAVRFPFGEDVRASLPYEAGVNAVFLFVYFWLLRRAIENQSTFRGFMSVYAHTTVVAAVAASLAIIVVVLRSEPLTVGLDQILHSNLAALSGTKGTGLAATLLARLELFTLWELAVVTIGFSALTRFSIGMAASIVLLPWGFVTMVRLAVAAVFGG